MSSITRPQWAAEQPDLTGKVVAVVGGSGGVGEGVTRALLETGATVIATGRDSARLADLDRRLAHSSLHVEVLDGLAGDLGARVDSLAARFGALDGVVVSVASWGDQGRKPLLALTDDEWSRLVEDNLTSVFRLFRAFAPALAPRGFLLQLNGMSADIPFPGNGVVALGAAAGKSMTRTIAVELRGSGRRAYEVILGVVRTRARQLAGVDDLRWIDGTEIGTHIAELLAGSSPLVDADLHYFVDKAVGPVADAPRL